ncbi:MAG TPA: hypothetical protein DCE71_07175 [Parachlamydiales bacterium]|nr:hypothetical protein [Parachlamydiales bacterium]
MFRRSQKIFINKKFQLFEGLIFLVSTIWKGGPQTSLAYRALRAILFDFLVIQISFVQDNEVFFSLDRRQFIFFLL